MDQRTIYNVYWIISPCQIIIKLPLSQHNYSLHMLCASFTNRCFTYCIVWTLKSLAITAKEIYWLWKTACTALRNEMCTLLHNNAATRGIILCESVCDLIGYVVHFFKRPLVSVNGRNCTVEEIFKITFIHAQLWLRALTSHTHRTQMQ